MRTVICCDERTSTGQEVLSWFEGFDILHIPTVGAPRVTHGAWTDSRLGMIAEMAEDLQRLEAVAKRMQRTSEIKNTPLDRSAWRPGDQP